MRTATSPRNCAARLALRLECTVISSLAIVLSRPRMRYGKARTPAAAKPHATKRIVRRTDGPNGRISSNSQLLKSNSTHKERPNHPPDEPLRLDLAFDLYPQRRCRGRVADLLKDE